MGRDDQSERKRLAGIAAMSSAAITYNNAFNANLEEASRL